MPNRENIITKSYPVSLLQAAEAVFGYRISETGAILKKQPNSHDKAPSKH